MNRLETGKELGGDLWVIDDREIHRWSADGRWYGFPQEAIREERPFLLVADFGESLLLATARGGSDVSVWRIGPSGQAELLAERLAAQK